MLKRDKEDNISISILTNFIKNKKILLLFILVLLIIILIKIYSATGGTFSYNYYKLEKYNKTDMYGNTPLINAVINGDSETAKKLINLGVNLNIRNANGSTALIASIEKGNDEIAKLLIEKGANLDIVNYEQNTALMVAVTRNNIEIANELLRHGADINYSNGYHTALIIATEKGYVEMAKMLLMNGANINYKNIVNNTALIIAAEKGYFELVKMLIELGADLNIINNYGFTALMYALNNNHVKIAKTLIENDADINIKGKDNNTAIDYALKLGNDEIIRLMIDKNTKPVTKWEWVGTESHITVLIKERIGFPSEFRIIAVQPTNGIIDDTFTGQFDENNTLIHNGQTLKETGTGFYVGKQNYTLCLKKENNGNVINCKITYYSKTGHWTWGENGGIDLYKTII